jgi:hypothetical protein
MDGLIKIVLPGSYEWQEHQTSLIKVAHGGRLRGDDYKDFTKSASALFLPRLSQILSALQPGDVPVHVLSHGATEITGSNRNGDGFPKQACMDYAWTFEKLSNWYRLHKNKNADIRYGICKAAAYNPHMGRVEAIYFLNGTKEAAARNGGYVADFEMQDLNSGRDLATSMSCKVPADFCSGCGNMAQKKAQYCGPATCPYGGLKTSMGRTFADGTRLHAINRQPFWFDTSYIPTKQADATAYAAVADYLTKAASAFEKSGGAYLAEEMEVSCSPEIDFFMRTYDRPLSKEASYASRRAELAHALARIERTDPSPAAVLGLATSRFDVSRLPAISKQASSAISLRRLADYGVILSPGDFLSWAMEEKHAQRIAAPFRAALRTVYTRLAEDGTLFKEGLFEAFDPISTFTKSGSFASESDALPLAAAMLTYDEHSLASAAVYRRSIEKAASGESLPAVSNNDPAPTDPDILGLAKHYALYKLAALDYLRTKQSHGAHPTWDEALLTNAVWQNRIA